MENVIRDYDIFVRKIMKETVQIQLLATKNQNPEPLSLNATIMGRRIRQYSACEIGIWNWTCFRFNLEMVFKFFSILGKKVSFWNEDV